MTMVICDALCLKRHFGYKLSEVLPMRLSKEKLALGVIFATSLDRMVSTIPRQMFLQMEKGLTGSARSSSGR